MRFPELCEALIRETGHAAVYFAQYPSFGTAMTGERAGRIIRTNGGEFEVGNEDEDRGTWVSDGVFPTEAAACDYVFRVLTAAPPVAAQQTPEQRERSAAANERFMRMLRRDAGGEGRK